MRLDEKESILSDTPSQNVVQNVVLWSLVLNSMIVLSLIYSLLLMTRWKILVPFLKIHFIVMAMMMFVLCLHFIGLLKINLSRNNSQMKPSKISFLW